MNNKRLAYIGTNNFEAGKIAGQETVKLFPNGGKLVAFVGNMGAQNARERYNGMKEALKGHNIEFLQEPFTDDKDAAKARRNVGDAITKYPGKIDGFLGLYSYNGPAWNYGGYGGNWGWYGHHHHHGYYHHHHHHHGHHHHW